MKRNLNNRLLIITLINVTILISFIAILLPSLLFPIFEDNVYKYLKQPHPLLIQNSDNELDDIAYFFVVNGSIVNISHNYEEIVSEEPSTIVSNIDEVYGKIKIKGKTYYYYVTTTNNSSSRVTITNNEYFLNLIRKSLISVLVVTIGSFIITILVLFTWTKKLVKKIENLKEKVDNIENLKYDHTKEIKVIDEISMLESSVENMRIRLKNNENEKNEMFQNISHDLKTPITVIKSHAEAIEEDVIEKEKGLKVIVEQTEKLKNKVNSLLYINKLNNLDEVYENIDLKNTINSSIKKFKLNNKKINWISKFDNSKFNGKEDMWEVVIDNLIENFLRYAKNSIKIEVKDNKIFLFNDGEPVNEKILKTLFDPYIKGNKGNHGLGLSIVKKTVNIFGYNITVENKKDGVLFTIK